MTCAESGAGAFAHNQKAFLVQTLTGSSQKIIGALGTHKTDVALVSGELQDGTQAGIKVLQTLWNVYQVPVIMFLESCSPEYVVSAFRSGARGIFYRTHSMKALSKCIQSVHRGQVWANSQDLGHILAAFTQTRSIRFSSADGVPLLTRREEDVVRLVADGLRNREIAERLKVNEHSIRNYLYRIFDKLGVSNRAEVILYALTRTDRIN